MHAIGHAETLCYKSVVPAPQTAEKRAPKCPKSVRSVSGLCPRVSAHARSMPGRRGAGRTVAARRTALVRPSQFA
jgi:hypothetical protein